MNELHAYVQNPLDPSANMSLARCYEVSGHLSPACGFYLRAAELSKDDDLSYECMLRLYYCFGALGDREYTCENALKSALKMKPRNPEAYFLISQFYERKGNWMDSYLYASLGLELTSLKPSGLAFGSSYESEYMLIFQKAVAAWWYGKPSESRKLLRLIMDDYGPVMNESYLKLVQGNLSRLGSGNETESSVRYDKSKYGQFKFKFCGLDLIERNYSQVCQDLFVLAMLGGKKEGTYLEIGAAHSHHNSNTALLEELGWKGIGVELKRDLAEQHASRKNRVICADALSLNYSSILSENFDCEIIDYLQLDIEPPKNTFDAMLSIPFEKYKFRVITYEHDHYVDLTKSYRDKSRRYLSSLGYTLVVNDVSPSGECSFEDWWVMEDLVDAEMLEKMRLQTNDINEIKNFFYSD
jgi:hypothetical protein